MYQLELHGVQAVLVDRDENDLWVRTPSGRMLTVQVKTASAPTCHGTERTFRVKFHIGNLGPSTDVYALVALHAEIVVFCRPDEMRKRFPVEYFTRQRMLASLEEHFA